MAWGCKITMLNAEEREEIELCDSISILKNTNLDINNIYSIDLRTYNVAVKTILNLIKKQSKEIAELKFQKEKKEFIMREQFKSMKSHIDLNNKCEIAYQNKIMKLEKEIEELKEDLKKKPTFLIKDIFSSKIKEISLQDAEGLIEQGREEVRDKIKAKIEEVEQWELYNMKIPRLSTLDERLGAKIGIKYVLQSLLEKE